MNTTVARRSLAAIVLASAVLLVLPGGGAAESLGGHPVCEASSAALVPCGDANGHCLLVGDNEQRTELYLYPFDGERLNVQTRRSLSLLPLLEALPADDREISDIEALTRLPSGEIVIYGSHSRNKECELKGKRRQYALGRLEADTIAPGSVGVVKSKSPQCKQLFGADADALQTPLKEVCTALTTAEEQGDAAEGNEEKCQQAGAFNIEGVVALPAPGGSTQLWVGLRSPLVRTHAVLLRQQQPLDELRFDDAAFLDLGGWGVRELTVARGWVWGIAGPVGDVAQGSFKLWRFRVGELRSGATIVPQDLGAVVLSAEGLAVSGQVAIILIDGDADNGACKTDATYEIRRVPL